jgi:flagellar hook-length control protein FliK
MMTGDRPIHLDLGMPGATAFGTPASGGQQTPADPRSQDELADDAHALRQLLQAQRQAPPSTSQPDTAAPSPFSLFGSPAAASTVPTSTTAHTEAAAQPPADLHDTLQQMAQRLLVDDGSSGRRAVQIQLGHDSLPGVVVDIHEEAGAVVAQFTCSQESSRARLARHADWLAQNLAERLQRPTSVRVQTDDPEDPCLTQAHAGS